MLVDEATGDILAARDAATPKPIASATKLMTAWIALRELRPGATVTAPDYAAGPTESLMGLEPGERVRVRDLLYGLLLVSGNDAASALALRISGSITDFVGTMNRTARRLGLDETSFADPIGLDGANVSSARDLVALTTRLRRNTLFREIVDTERITVGTPPFRHRLTNRNTLVLDVPFVDGVKTGTTLAAGYVLVASGERKGVGLVAALLGAPGEAARDSAMLELFDYGHSLYRRQALVSGGERIAALDLGERGRLPLLAAATVRDVARDDAEIEVRYEVPSSPGGEIVRGQAFGTGTVVLDGREIGEVEVVAARAVASLPESGVPKWAWIALGGAGSIAVMIAAFVVARRRPR